MWIRKIRGIEPCVLVQLVEQKIKQLDYRANVEVKSNSIKIINVRLTKLKPNTYWCERSPFWYVIEKQDKIGRVTLGAQNAMHGRTHYFHPIRNNYYLQYDDWVKLNAELNSICDKHGISASIYSRGEKIRDGLEQKMPSKLYMLQNPFEPSSRTRACLKCNKLFAVSPESPIAICRKCEPDELKAVSKQLKLKPTGALNKLYYEVLAHSLKDNGGDSNG